MFDPQAGDGKKFQRNGWRSFFFYCFADSFFWGARIVVAVVLYGDPSHIANTTYDRGTSTNNGVR
jgi:hypothetical protein